MKPVAGRCAMYCAALVMGLSLSRPALAQQAGGLPYSPDGMTLDQQSSAVQAQFTATWGDKAAAEWITEHNRAIMVARATAWGFPPQFVGPAPDGPPVVADTTVVPLSTLTDHAPLAGDLIDIDQQAHRMYLGHADADAIEVFDVSTSTPHWIHSIHVPGGVSGILVVPDLKKVFGGSPNGLVIADIDPNSPTAYTPLAYVYLGPGGSDELDYDPVNRKVLITDPPDNIVGDVDAIHNTLIKTFTGLGVDLEQPRYNSGDGMMYETVRGANMLYKFNLASDTLVSQTPVGKQCRPNGLAIKPTTGLALLGCSTRDHIIFWDLKSNSIASTSAQDGGADVVLYNATADRFFAASGGFHLGPAMGMYDGSGNFISNVPTTFASHEVAYDQTNRVVYTIGGGLVSFTLPR